MRIPADNVDKGKEEQEKVWIGDKMPDLGRGMTPFVTVDEQPKKGGVGLDNHG